MLHSVDKTTENTEVEVKSCDNKVTISLLLQCFLLWEKYEVVTWLIPAVPYFLLLIFFCFSSPIYPNIIFNSCAAPLVSVIWFLLSENCFVDRGCVSQVYYMISISSLHTKELHRSLIKEGVDSAVSLWGKPQKPTQTHLGRGAQIFNRPQTTPEVWVLQ